MRGDYPAQREHQKDHKEARLENIGDERGAQAAPAGVQQGDQREEHSCDDEGGTTRGAVVTADDGGVGPHLVEKADEDGSREAERSGDAVVAGEEVCHGLGPKAAAQAIDRVAGERDAQPVHRVSDAAHDAELIAHVRAVVDRLGEDPGNEDRGGDHQGACRLAVFVGALKESADSNGLGRDGEHDDAVNDEKTPEQRACCSASHRCGPFKCAARWQTSGERCCP